MDRTLEEQREEFSRRRFLATPLSGIIAWAIACIGGGFLPDLYAFWVLFIATGSIVYLSLLISKLPGENFIVINKDKDSNPKIGNEYYLFPQTQQKILQFLPRINP